VADGLHAAVELVEAADPQAVGDGLGVETSIEELGACDHAVLRSGEASGRRIGDVLD
jgi:hypothetical protein